MIPTWLKTACTLLEVEPAIVRVTVAHTRGSSPREPGATMLVSGTRQWGTIGGGHLEWQAVEQARQMLCARDTAPVRIDPLLLGPDLAQCCGGEVTLWTERLAASERASLAGLATALADGGPRMTLGTQLQGETVRREVSRALQSDAATDRITLDTGAFALTERHDAAAQPLWIFGAGHVGQAVLQLLRPLPMFAVTCIDSRPDICAAARRDTGMPVTPVHEPVDCIPTAPPETAFLVLTHDHELDYQLCAAILARGDAAWLGLIGSASKAARFRSRLRRDGFDAPTIARLVSPVGLTAIRSKLPAAIAIGITAQLLEQVGAAPALRRIVQAPAVAADCDPACGRCAERRHAC